MALFATAAGLNYTRASQMMGHAITAASVQIYEGSTLRQSAAATGFFTEVANRGVNVNTDFTAGVAKTILNVVGAGVVSHIIGPTAPGAGETTTITITKDGVAKALTFAPPSGYRIVLGPVRGGADMITTGVWMHPTFPLVAAKTYMSGGVVAITPVIPDWDWMKMFGVPCLEFSTSMVVQITHSTNVTDTAADGRQSGVLYMMEQ